MNVAYKVHTQRTFLKDRTTIYCAARTTISSRNEANVPINALEKANDVQKTEASRSFGRIADLLFSYCSPEEALWRHPGDVLFLNAYFDFQN